MMKPTCSLIEILMKHELSQNRAIALIRDYGRAAVERALAAYANACRKGNSIKNPAGYIVKLAKTNCGKVFDLERYLKNRQKYLVDQERRGLGTAEEDEAFDLLLHYTTKEQILAELDIVIRKHRDTYADANAISAQREYAGKLLAEAVDLRERIEAYPYRSFDEIFGYA